MAAFNIVVVLASLCLAQVAFADNGENNGIASIKRTQANTNTAVTNGLALLSIYTDNANSASAAVAADSTVKIDFLQTSTAAKATTAGDAKCAADAVAAVAAKYDTAKANLNACLAQKVQQFADISASITTLGASASSYATEMTAIGSCPNAITSLNLLCVSTQLAKANNDFKNIATAVAAAKDNAALLDAGIRADMLWCEIIHVGDLYLAASAMEACDNVIVEEVIAME